MADLDLNSLTSGAWILAVVGAALVGLAKTGVPGLGVLSVAIFATCLPARESAGVVLPLLICADIAAVVSYRSQVSWAHLLRLFPWAISGIVVGYFAVDVISSEATRRLIGTILIGLIGVQIWRSRQSEVKESVPQVSPPLAAATGLLAGFTTMVANAAGPIMNLYLLAMRFPKMQFMGTAAWYFFLLNSFKVPFSAGLGLITGETLLFNLKLTPAVLAGSLLGRVVIHRIPQKLFERLALGLALAAGVRLLF